MRRAVCFTRRCTYIHCTPHVAPTPSLDLDVTHFISRRFYRARFISYNLPDSPACTFFPMNANTPCGMFTFFLSLFVRYRRKKGRHFDSKLPRALNGAVSSSGDVRLFQI